MHRSFIMQTKTESIRVACVVFIGLVLVTYTAFFAISDPKFGYEDNYSDNHPFY